MLTCPTLSVAAVHPGNPLLLFKGLKLRDLQLSLGGRKSRGEKFAHLVGSLVQVVAHLVASQTLRDDVEVETK